MSEDAGRPTPQQLPRLQIPVRRCKTVPEEISTSCVDEFLQFCQVHNRAPMTWLGDLPVLPPSFKADPDPDLEMKKARREKLKKRVEKRDDDSPPGTLDFTDHENEEMADVWARLADVKAQHTDWGIELEIEPKNRKALEQCRYWRKIREGLNLELQAILKRKEIRREFRKDFNHVNGVENW
ncbi:hypothetical protein GGR54DRAFT_641419 [Hypoxylon sp. NC1633]|nr:hypothetical protein GGR54DRAFT_641419 [Hypoxylon sp. NC1633]